jgi:hypothetical protein
MVFCVMTPCSLLSEYQLFLEKQMASILQGRIFEDRANTFLRIEVQGTRKLQYVNGEYLQ